MSAFETGWDWKHCFAIQNLAISTMCCSLFVFFGFYIFFVRVVWFSWLVWYYVLSNIFGSWCNSFMWYHLMTRCWGKLIIFLGRGLKYFWMMEYSFTLVESTACIFLNNNQTISCILFYFCYRKDPTSTMNVTSWCVDFATALRKSCWFIFVFLETQWSYICNECYILVWVFLLTVPKNTYCEFIF